MLSSRSIDTLAEAIADQIEPGQLTSVLLRRFFRAGRRVGRKRRPAESYAKFVEDGVDRAVAAHMERFVERRTMLTIEVGRVDAEISVAREEISERTERLERSTASPPMAPDPLDDPTGRVHALALKRHFESLDRERRALAESERRVLELTQNRASVDGELVELGHAFSERINGSYRAGQMVWDRFCMGFEAGRNSRGRPDFEGDSPLRDLDFRRPVEVNRAIEREVA